MGGSSEERPPCLRWLYLFFQGSLFLGASSLAVFSPKSLGCSLQTHLCFEEQPVQAAWPAQSISSPHCVLYQGHKTYLTSCALAQTEVMIFTQKWLRSSTPLDTVFPVCGAVKVWKYEDTTTLTSLQWSTVFACQNFCLWTLCWRMTTPSLILRFISLFDFLCLLNGLLCIIAACCCQETRLTLSVRVLKIKRGEVIFYLPIPFCSLAQKFLHSSSVVEQIWRSIVGCLFCSMGVRAGSFAKFLWLGLELFEDPDLLTHLTYNKFNHC